MTWLLVTQRPSSLTATAPASFRSAISVSCSPRWPTVMAPIGCRRTVAERARLRDEHLGDDARVVDGARVRHAADVDEAARRRGAQAALHVFLALGAGLAQVRVEIDEPRQQPRAGPLDDAHALARRRGRPPRRGPTRVMRPRSTTTSTSASSAPAGSTARTRRKTTASVMAPRAPIAPIGGPGASNSERAPPANEPARTRRLRAGQNEPVAPSEPRPTTGTMRTPVVGAALGCVTRRIAPDGAADAGHDEAHGRDRADRVVAAQIALRGRRCAVGLAFAGEGRVLAHGEDAGDAAERRARRRPRRRRPTARSCAPCWGPRRGRRRGS